MIERPKTPRSGPGIPLLFSLVTLAIYAVTRIGLALWTGPSAVPFAAWPPMLAQGLWFDLAALTTLLAPVLLYEAALPNRWRASRPHCVLRLTWFALILFVLLFGAVAEATFWLDSPTRFNFIAVDYLLYTHEVIGNIRESYPVPWILAGIGLAALGDRLRSTRLAPARRCDPPFRRRSPRLRDGCSRDAGARDERGLHRPDGPDRQRLRR